MAKSLPRSMAFLYRLKKLTSRKMNKLQQVKMKIKTTIKVDLMAKKMETSLLKPNNLNQKVKQNHLKRP